MAIVAPDFRLAGVTRSGRMHCIASANVHVGGDAAYQGDHSPQERAADGNQSPNPFIHMLLERGEQLPALSRTERSFTRVTMEHARHFAQCPRGRHQRLRAPYDGANRFAPLSPGTLGNSFQNRVISGSFGLEWALDNGRSSATGSPRRSISMTVPPAASRISSDVRMWRSRTEALRIATL
jgi:hypothetical protein